MRRRGKKTQSGRIGRAATWVLVAALAGWGIWQFMAVRHTLVQEASAQRQPASPEQGRPAGDAVFDQARVYVDPASEETVEEEGVSDKSLAPSAAALTVEQAAERGRQIDAQMEAADAALDAGDPLTGRRELNLALSQLDDGLRAQEVRQRLEHLNAGVFMGPDLYPGDHYALLISIMPGDTYDRLAKRYHITPELLEILNPHTDPRKLRPGEGLKVTFGPYHARVRRTERQLDLYDRDLYVKTYDVQIDDGVMLPVGTYRVSGDGKIRVGSGATARQWIELDAVKSDGPAAREGAWLYGSAGPRYADGQVQGVRMRDGDLGQVFAALIERASYVRVDP